MMESNRELAWVKWNKQDGNKIMEKQEHGKYDPSNS